MSLVRWNPFTETDTLFNRMMPRGFTNFPYMAFEGTNGKKLEWTPSADISETEKEYVVRAELPAVQKEDVHVMVENDVLMIKGERKQQKDDKNEKFHRVESFYGYFERSFTLPENVNADMIRCESKDGILTVHMPKTEAPKAKAKQITVQ